MVLNYLFLYYFFVHFLRKSDLVIAGEIIVDEEQKK